MLVWTLQQAEIPSQDAEQLCNKLNPKIIEGALNALTRALFNTIYGAVEGLPIVAAWILCGDEYVNLATRFPSLPSLTSGALDALINELRQFIGRPDIVFNPIWGKRAWLRAPDPSYAADVPLPESPQTEPASSSSSPVPTAEAEPTAPSPGKPDPTSDVPERDAENASTSEAETASTPNTETAPTAGGGLVNVGIDPAIIQAIRWALRSQPARETNTPAPAEKAGPQTLEEIKQDLINYGVDINAGRHALLDQAESVARAKASARAQSAPEQSETLPAAAELESEERKPKEPEPEKPEPKGWQVKRLLRYLRKSHRPDGKTSRKETYKDLIQKFAQDPDVIAENRKKMRANPSPEVMAICRNFLGYAD
jgi:hypothetical protein